MLTEKSLWIQGRKRKYLIQSGNTGKTIIAFHGKSTSNQYFADETRFHERCSHTVIYPLGAGLIPSWNAGSDPTTTWAEENNIDDIGFINQILTKESMEDIVLATGHSNGGRMVYHLAGDSYLIDAGVSNAGAPSDPTISTPNPKPLLHIHGDADWIEPFDGGGIGGGGLAVEPGLQRFRDAGYPVTVQMIQNGKHQWDFGINFDTTGYVLDWFNNVTP